MSNKRRLYKIAEKIRSIVALELQHMDDPRFSLVTISSVMLSPDASTAKIYWLVSAKDELEREQRILEVEDAFGHATRAIRKNLAGKLGTRFVPQIKFFYDDTLEVYDQVAELMSKIH